MYRKKNIYENMNNIIKTNKKIVRLMIFCGKTHYFNSGMKAE